VHEQQAINQNVAIATGNVHTTLTTSPVLAPGNYLVDLTISFNNLTPGAQVLCGTTTTASTDVDAGNYGDVQNEGTVATTGSCSVISAVTINNANDHIVAWATVFQGPGGPAAYSWSMSELPVGNLVITLTPPWPGARPTGPRAPAAVDGHDVTACIPARTILG